MSDQEQNDGGKEPDKADPFASAPNYVLVGSGSTANDGPSERESALEQTNLAKIREICQGKNRPPIIVLFGFSGSGKTTFAYRLQLLGPRDHYAFDPPVSKNRTVPSTDIVQHYWMSSTKGGQRALLIDLPGERFRRARSLNFKGELATDILTLIGAADAFVLFLEADKTLYSRAWVALNKLRSPAEAARFEEVADNHRGFIEDIMEFANLDGRLQMEIFRAGSVQAGVRAHQASTGSNNGEVRPTRKPTFLALSIADRLRTSLPNFEFKEEEAAALRAGFDSDPLLLVRHFQNDLYHRLMACFRTFRIDFVTAFENLQVKPGDQIEDEEHAHFGVRENFRWLREAARRERGRFRLRGASSLGLGFLTTLLDNAPSAFDASKAIAARTAWNADLRE